MDVNAGREGAGRAPLAPPPPGATRPRVELRIDHLVLEGVRPADAATVAAALERELGRLTSAGGIPAAWRDGARVPPLDAGSLHAAPGTSPHALGVQIAQALHRSLREGTGR